MGRRPGLYAMYKNDKFIAMGTVRELAIQCQVSERAIWNKTDKDAGMAGWTTYGSLKLIMGECSREDYEMNAIGDESMFEPSKEFKEWLDNHYHFGPMLIMIALIYGNYELEEEEHG